MKQEGVLTARFKMKWQILILFILTFILGAGLVNASSLNFINPAEYFPSPEQNINFSTTFNNTVDGNISFSFNVLNRSSIENNFTVLFEGNISNGTMWNRTFSMPEGRHYYRINITNVTNSDRPQISDERVVDVILGYNFITIGNGVINLSITTGNATFKDVVTAGSFVSLGNIINLGNILVSGSLNATNINTTGQTILAYNSGNVGIGTTIPNSSLHTKGNISTGSSSSINANGIQIVVLYFFNSTLASNTGLIPSCNNETTNGAMVYNASAGEVLLCINGTKWVDIRR